MGGFEPGVSVDSQFRTHSRRHRQDILKVQELFLLHIGGSALEVPDTIRYVKEKSGFLVFFSQTSYLAATRVCSSCWILLSDLGVDDTVPSLHLAEQNERKRKASYLFS
jgi:hypothetical protein